MIQEFLDARSPLRKKLDEIRSRGHLEDEAERKERSWTAPLAHARFEYDVNDDSLLRDTPRAKDNRRDSAMWYVGKAELQQRTGDGETYDFLPTVQAHRAGKIKVC